MYPMVCQVSETEAKWWLTELLESPSQYIMRAISQASTVRCCPL